jgi:hypothetical protein
MAPSANRLERSFACTAYKDHGAIILWWDEAEGDGVAGDNPDGLDHTIGEIVISADAHPNEGAVPFASNVFLTHSLICAPCRKSST